MMRKLHDTRKLSFWCRVGWHKRWYTDGAMFTSAQRCTFCNEPRSATDYQALQNERRLWGEVKANGIVGIAAQKQWVLSQMYDK